MDEAKSHRPIKALEMAEQAGRAFLDLVLPLRCVECGQIVKGAVGFCPECWSGLEFLGGPACARCDFPFEMAQGDGAVCGACLADPPPFERVVTPLKYGQSTRNVVLRLKYGRRIGTALLMARLMAPGLRELAATSEAQSGQSVILVPVPLHRWRLWWRGFNQAALLAQHLAAGAAVPCIVDALVRHRKTVPLIGLNKKARVRAVKGAFSLGHRASDTVRGRHIILVDDVFTTGATASACARSLLKAGADKVSILAFARALSHDQMISPS